MLVTGIILGICLLLFFIIYSAFTDETDSFGVGILWTILLVVSIGLIISGAQDGDPIKHSSSEYSVDTQITTTIVDGCITKHDTTYIFTPLK